MTNIKKIAKLPEIGFAMLPMGVAQYMTGNELKVYSTLLGFVDKKTGECFPSLGLLQKLTGINRTNISRITTKLSKDGWVKKKQRHNTSTLYTVYIPVENLKEKAEREGGYHYTPSIKDSASKANDNESTSNETSKIAVPFTEELKF